MLLPCLKNVMLIFRELTVMLSSLDSV